MKTTMLPANPDANSPVGADIRYLKDSATKNISDAKHRLEVSVPPRMYGSEETDFVVKYYDLASGISGEAELKKYLNQAKKSGGPVLE